MKNNSYGKTLHELYLVQTDNKNYCERVFDIKDVVEGNELFYTLYKPEKVEHGVTEWKAFKDFTTYLEALQFLCDTNLMFENRIIAEGRK